MKFTIFGATRNTGRHVMEQALVAGHTVTAVARTPDAISLQHPCLSVIRGDVLDLPGLLDVCSGSEVVISTLGVSSRGPTTVYSEGTANILRAMVRADVRRLICLSASGLDPGPWWQQRLAKPILWTVYREGYTDMTRMEAVVRGSDRDWTIVRPPRLTNGPLTRRYHDAINQPLKCGWKISRADLAAYLLEIVLRKETIHSVVEVAN